MSTGEGFLATRSLSKAKEKMEFDVPEDIVLLRKRELKNTAAGHSLTPSN